MLKRRLIPVLFLKNGLVVRSQEFVDFREFGNPLGQLERLNDWQADELIYIDISREAFYDLKRDDHKVASRNSVIDILRDISTRSFMPLTFGGRIFQFEQAAAFIRNGADKVIVNSGAYHKESLIGEIATYFGSQCVVVGIDVKKDVTGKHEVFVDQGKTKISYSPVEWARIVEDRGAGEIFLNSIDRDGTASGYDIDAINAIVEAVHIPVIACGGAGMFEHFEEVYKKTNASAVAAGNIFNFTENAYVRAKKQLVQGECNVRSH